MFNGKEGSYQPPLLWYSYSSKAQPCVGMLPRTQLPQITMGSWPKLCKSCRGVLAG